MAYTPNENLYGLLRNDPKRIYTIAEAGLNHGGSKERALALVRAAKWAGADAVKFQTFRTERQASARPVPPAHKNEQPDQPELFKRLELPFDTFKALYKEAQRIGIEFLSTPFDEESADFLNDLGVNAFTIASGDMTRRPFIEHVARKGKPVLLSAGMSTAEEIENAIGWMHMQSNEKVALLHCVSAYPAKREELNLKCIELLRDRFGLPVGFSDHSAGTLGSIVATSLGAQIIERHFMIETRGETPDHAVSLDAKTLKTHIEELRTIGAILGERGKFAGEAEAKNSTASSGVLYARDTAVSKHAPRAIAAKAAVR
jgi:N,N'-diacetyllegionaminate synthase